MESKEQFIRRVLEIAEKYDKADVPLIGSTIEMLVNKGMPNGCFQDYGLLMDLISILTVFERYIKTKES